MAIFQLDDVYITGLLPEKLNGTVKHTDMGATFRTIHNNKGSKWGVFTGSNVSLQLFADF